MSSTPIWEALGWRGLSHRSVSEYLVMPRDPLRLWQGIQNPVLLGPVSRTKVQEGF